jgi:hypothetical protein
MRVAQGTNECDFDFRLEARKEKTYARGGRQPGTAGFRTASKRRVL